MTAGKPSTIARAQLTLEIDGAGGAWGPECTIEQVHKQASDAAIAMIRARLTERGVRIIGEPRITMIMVPGDP